MFATLVFVLIVLLGIVGNVQGIKSNAFAGWHIWFWNIVWVLALKAVWVPITG